MHLFLGPYWKSKANAEFLGLVRTNDMDKTYETPLEQRARKRIQEVRSDKALKVSYMTYAQKMMDERRIGYLDGREEDLEEGMKKGVEEGLKKAVRALQGALDPAVIAEQFKMSLEQVMDILGQK